MAALPPRSRRARRLSIAALCAGMACGGACALPEYNATSGSGASSSSAAGTAGNAGAGGSTGGGAGSSTGGQAGTAGSSGTAGTGGTAGSSGTAGTGGAGGCMGGVCDVEVLQQSLVAGERYGHLLVDSGFVYFTAGLSILKVAVDATPATKAMNIFQGNGSPPDFLYINVNTIYFTLPGTGDIYQCDKSQAGCVFDVVAPGEQYPLALTFLNNDLYWGQHISNATIRRHTFSAPPATTDYIATGVDNIFYVVSDGITVFWTYQGQGADAGGVQKVDMVNNSVKPIASMQSAPSGLAVDTSSVYWLTDDGALWVAPKDGNMISQIAPPLNKQSLFAGEIVTDSTHVYWPAPGVNSCVGMKPCPCGAACGTILRAKKADPANTVEEFAVGNWKDVWGLAGDADYIYWTSGDDQRLLRKHK